MNVHRDGQRTVNRNLNHPIARLRIATRVESDDFLFPPLPGHAACRFEISYHEKTSQVIGAAKDRRCSWEYGAAVRSTIGICDSVPA